MRGKHNDCARTVRDAMAKQGCEVTVGESVPLVMNPYVRAVRCPHGTELYYEPTSDQIAVWVRDGVR